MTDAGAVLTVTKLKEELDEIYLGKGISCRPSEAYPRVKVGIRKITVTLFLKYNSQNSIVVYKIGD